VFWKSTEKDEAAGVHTPNESGGEKNSNVSDMEEASSVESEVTGLVQDNVEIAKVDSEVTSLVQDNVEIAKVDSEGTSLVQDNVEIAKVDSEGTSLVQGKVENAKVSSANHPAMATYIGKYPDLFGPEFFGKVDAHRNQGTTKNVEDDSAGTGINIGIVNSDLGGNGSVSESVEELHAINSTAKQLLSGGTSHFDVTPSGIAGGPITKSKRKNRKRRNRRRKNRKKGGNV
jgi:hypothetical protein